MKFVEYLDKFPKLSTMWFFCTYILNLHKFKQEIYKTQNTDKQKLLLFKLKGTKDIKSFLDKKKPQVGQVSQGITKFD